MRGAALAAIAVLLTAGFAPTAGAASPSTQEEFERALAAMQDDVDAAVAAYADGDADAALAAAERVTQRFASDASGASDLERAIKTASAVAVGDRVKALASRLASAIEGGAPVSEVEAIGDELAPSLNRLVLVAQGKATAASRRALKTPEAIDAAVAEVEGHVADAVRLAGAGESTAAVAAAKDAFFAFEVNGLGPDSEVVDKGLEDRAENLIVNFNEATVEEAPGLSQLIENGAPATDIEAQAEAIREALAEVAELLKATLPPVSLGDANGDGRVSIVDALLVAQAALGVREESPDMDVNGDGRVSIVDALLIAQAALGLREL